MKYYVLFIAALILVSCGSGTGKSNVQEVTDPAIDSSVVDTDSENAGKVLATVPTSHEIIAVLVDHPDTRYDASLLNSQSSYLKYNTTISKSINLGAYGVDMSYASLFNQNQTVLQYMAVVKTMAEQLGILRFFDEATMQKMEQNLDNKEVMIDLISTAFYKSDKYLLENGQREIAAMIIAGAWIEAMNTACCLTKSNYGLNQKLSSRILKQCESIDLMITFLSEYTDGSIGEIANDFNQIDSIIKQAKITPLANDSYYCNDEDFTKICEKIYEIRSRYVSM